MAEEVRVRQPIRWHIPKTIETKYATNMVIQHTKGEFTISFFEIRAPIVLGTPEEQAEQLEKGDKVEARCVARIVVTPDRLPGFIKVMADNLGNYYSTYDNVEDDNSNE